MCVSEIHTHTQLSPVLLLLLFGFVNQNKKEKKKLKKKKKKWATRVLRGLSPACEYYIETQMPIVQSVAQSLDSSDKQGRTQVKNEIKREMVSRTHSI